MSAVFDYENLSARPAGPVLTALSWALPGVREVRSQTAPYAAFWRASNAAALEQDGPLWVALGDSMTQGIGASAPDRGYVGQLRDHLAAAGRAHRLVNLSVTGARVQDLVTHQLPALERLVGGGEVPDLVTVVIGSNDVLSPRSRAGLAGRFEAMLDRLPPGAVVANLPNPQSEARRVGTVLRERAARGELVVADIRAHGPRTWRGRLAADRFHPNDMGYAGMARVFDVALGLPGGEG
ncbi:hypothetical protein GCM10027517_29440 [Phycicoccus ginsengisoli]